VPRDFVAVLAPHQEGRAAVVMSAHRDHVADKPEAGFVGRYQLVGAVDVDGGPVGVDGQDGVDLGGEQVG
jgi:hypothetical protein